MENNVQQQAARRLAHISSALKVEEENSTFLKAEDCANVKQSPDDIVIVCALRTPITKAKRGAFKDTHPTELLAAVLKGVIDKTKIDPKLVGDIVVGTVLPPGGGATQARMAMILAGFPEDVPIHTLNRQCSSGLQAFANVAAAIQNGYYDIGIAAGFESMSQYDMMSSVGEVNPKVFEHPVAKDCLCSMGETSENVAAKYGISREKQDEFAVLSNEKALKAIAEGRFKDEILPVTTKVTGADGVEKVVTVSQDEGPRKTTLADLKKLKPAFKEGGTTTAGNASQVSDGAAAVLTMKRKTAQKLGLPIFGSFVSYSVVGVPASLMGIGPAFAIPDALKKANLKVEDIDIYEINEAFASQATYCVDKLGIPLAKVNPSGGAIALGHPLGCTGARQIATLLNGLKQRGGKYGVVSMCIGTGMGAAGVFRLE